MKFVTVRDLRGNPGRVWKDLAEQKDLVLTANGRPRAIISEVSEETLEETLAAARRARALRAVEDMQEKSEKTGSRLTTGVVESEIRSVRRARRRR